MVSIPFSLIYVSHGKLGDDWPASQVIHFIPFRFGELNLRTFLYEMYFNTKAWMDGQGRFMPFSSLSGGLFFVLFETEKSQNLIRLLFLILNILIYSKIVQFFYYDLKYGILIPLLDTEFCFPSQLFLQVWQYYIYVRPQLLSLELNINYIFLCPLFFSYFPCLLTK
jgi:hypothetical protein